MIENILILDTETTGLAPKKGDQVIEIGVILFNLKYKSVLQSFSTLVPCEENPVERINHIPAGLTQCKYPRQTNDQYFMESVLPSMAEAAQAIVAHNAEFDRGFVAAMPCCRSLAEMQWICTKRNFTWPCHLTRFSLEAVCAGMGVPYVQAHRALNDCQLLAQCFQKIHDLEERFARCA